MTQARHPVRPSLLDDGEKLAGVAGAVLLVSFFLPWFQKSVLPAGAKAFVSQNLSAFGAFSWIEAALLLVNGAVLLLLYLRSTGRRVELPTDDGTMIALAGGWMLVLVLARVVFAKPVVTGTSASVGLQWGLLVAMGAAGGMLAAGLASRSRAHASRTPAEPVVPESDVPPRWRRPTG